MFVDGRYISPETWYDADGAPFQPQVHYFVGGATKLYGAALYRLRPQDFGEIRHVDGVSPAWPLTYDDFEPWYTKAEWLYQVHGNHGEDPTEGPWSKQYPWPAVSHEPRIKEISDQLAAAGYHPFSAPCGILLDEADRARSTCIRCTWCDGYPCLVHAKSDAETIAVRPLLDAPNVTLLVGAEVRPARDRPHRSHRHRRGGVAGRGRGGLRRRHRGRVGRRVEQRQVAAAVGHRSRTPTGSPTAPTRSGATTCSTTPRPSWRWPRSATTPCSRRRWASTTSTSTTASGEGPARQHPDGRQVQRLRDEGRGTEADEARPALEPRRRRPPRRRLLADHRGSPGPRQPGHRRRRRQHPPRLHVEQRPRGRRALPRAAQDPQPHRHGPAPRARQELLHEAWTSPSPASPTRPAPAASAPIRPRRCSTSTARPTSSTTSTSSTPASSRASAP